jgi:type II secretory ATPase GspE/PulE/Tfp pilus assembly ATPase PilB-like protein
MNGVARADEMQLLRQCGVTAKRKRIFRVGPGCECCHGTGYSGRVGVFEIFTVNNEIRELVRDGASESIIRKAALDTGMITLLQSGLRKVLEGETSMEEVRRVLEL